MIDARNDTITRYPGNLHPFSRISMNFNPPSRRLKCSLLAASNVAYNERERKASIAYIALIMNGPQIRRELLITSVQTHGFYYDYTFAGYIFRR